MDWTQIVITAITVILSSGLIQFLLSRKDKKEEDAKTDHFDLLRKEFKAGLEEREKTGRMRYDEHHVSIEKMSLQHQKDFQMLLDAIKQLEKNDTNITESIKVITDTQQNIGNAIIGLAHDKLVYSTDKIIERGAVTMKEKATLESIYAPYVKLGGNSYAKKGMEHVDKLPVVTEEEAKVMDIKLKNYQKSIV